MTRICVSRLALLLVACLPALAGATAQRTFVRSNGVDNLTCSLIAPCRQFAAAVAATSANGEVIVLDSAGYGIVSIGKAVSIIAPPGVYAGISVFAGFDGVTVAAGSTDKVVLRGLTINGQGGDNGIHVTSAGETHIEDCTVANLSQNGILIEGGAAVHITRTVARSNGGVGVFVQPATAIAIATTLTDSTLANNVETGFSAIITFAGAAIDAALTRVTALRNGSTGFVASNNSTGTVTMVVADSIAAENEGGGVLVGGANATAIVSGSSLVRNIAADLAQFSPAVLRTAGNNALTGRGAADVIGTLTPNPLK